MNTAPLRVLHAFSTFAVGGPQRRFATLSRTLGAGFAHVVTAMDGNFDCLRLVEAPERVRTLAVAVEKNAGLSLANLRVFRRCLGAERPDILVTYNWGAVEWALANRFLPLVRHLHVEDGFGPDESGEHQHRRRIVMRRLALSGRSRILVPSRTLERLATGRWGFRPERVAYVPNGIDCHALAEAATRRTGTADGPLLGTLATLRPEKDIPLLLRAFALLPDRSARLVVAGDGPERGHLIETAAALGLADRVEFPGFTAPAELFGRLELFVLSSTTEQMPYSVIEAMACGRAVASTDVGDVGEMLAEANRRYLSPPGDAEGLARNIAALIADPARRAALGRDNQARAFAEFDLETMTARWAEMLGGPALSSE